MELRALFSFVRVIVYQRPLRVRSNSHIRLLNAIDYVICSYQYTGMIKSVVCAIHRIHMTQQLM